MNLNKRLDLNKGNKMGKCSHPKWKARIQRAEIFMG